MRPRVLALVVAISLTVGMGLVGGAVPGSGQPDGPLGQPDDLDADEVRIDVALDEDGSAAWTIEFMVELSDEDSETAFESIRADVKDDPDAFTQAFEDRIASTVETAEAATERTMTADGFAVETERRSLAREYGVLRYSFDWDGFAAIEGGEIHAGDAIEGLYLDDGTRLLVSWPEGYERASVSPEPDDERDTAVIWYGSETAFVPGEPRLVAAPASTGPGLGVVAGVLGAVAVLSGAVGLYLYRRRARSLPSAVGDDPEPAGTSERSEATPERVADESLLSNEEQVVRLLETNGGRMKQQQVVEELGWTDAKTSKVVSALREEGTVESFRIGRENVLRFPDDGQESDAPDATGAQ